MVAVVSDTVVDRIDVPEEIVVAVVSDSIVGGVDVSG